MITFFKTKGSRTSNDPYADTPVLTVDATPQGREKAGFAANKAAQELLNLELTGKEYLVFAQDGNRVFLTVANMDTVEAKNCVACRVGKTGKGNNKEAWELVTSMATVEPDSYVKIVKVDAEADADEVFEILPSDSTVETSNETDNQIPKVQEGPVETTQETETTTFEGF